jgi:transcriptional regulator with XRE-family HTH domain
MLNVSRQAVSKWEAGNSLPELEKLIAIADIFNVSVDYLVRDTTEVRETVSAQNNNLDTQAVMEQLDEINASIKKRYIYEYKSKKYLFGLPLVHIKLARNGIALARGIIAIGNASIGIISIGGFALGLFSIGGIALGLLAALGGIAIGGISVAGVSIGLFAVGGVALGEYALGSVAVASRIALGAVAKGNIAIGTVADGGHAMNIHTVSKEMVKEVILDQYPQINRLILNIFLAIIR